MEGLPKKKRKTHDVDYSIVNTNNTYNTPSRFDLNAAFELIKEFYSKKAFDIEHDSNSTSVFYTLKYQISKEGEVTVLDIIICVSMSTTCVDIKAKTPDDIKNRYICEFTYDDDHNYEFKYLNFSYDPDFYIDKFKQLHISVSEISFLFFSELGKELRPAPNKTFIMDAATFVIDNVEFDLSHFKYLTTTKPYYSKFYFSADQDISQYLKTELEKTFGMFSQNADLKPRIEKCKEIYDNFTTTNVVQFSKKFDDYQIKEFFQILWEYVKNGKQKKIHTYDMLRSISNTVASICPYFLLELHKQDQQKYEEQIRQGIYHRETAFGFGCC